MKTIRRVTVAVVLACAGLGGCATSHDSMDAVVWVQSSTEYAAVTEGVYAAATAQLNTLVHSQTGSKRELAVVLDIDETVLDNSRYQGQLIVDNARYSSATWDDWVGKRQATAVPGAVEFIQAAQALGVHVALITNRPCLERTDTGGHCPQHEDTLINLQQVGVNTGATSLYLLGDRPSASCESLLSAAERADGKWSSDKTSRRKCVMLDYEIVMLFGDQLGDFTEGEERGQWGEGWFMLPNPTYGGWLPRTSPEKRALIHTAD